MFKLYDYYRSSAAFRVRLALNYKKLSYNKIPVSLIDGVQQSKEYLELNPSGLVPSLLDENNNLIGQSLAIIEYLDDIHPDPALLPPDAIEKAYVRRISLSIATDIHPLNNLRVLNYLRHNLNQTEDEVGKWHRHWIDVGLGTVEKLVSTSKFYIGVFAFKDQFTLADVCILPQLVNARRFNGQVKDYPTLLAIEEKCRSFNWVNEAYPATI